MPSLGPAEILVILVVALLVFGPNKMPEIGRQVARGVREFRKVQQHLSSELHGVISELDVDPAPEPTPGGDPPPTLPPKDVAVPPIDDATATGPSGEAPPSPPTDPA